MFKFDFFALYGSILIMLGITFDLFFFDFEFLELIARPIIWLGLFMVLIFISIKTFRKINQS